MSSENESVSPPLNVEKCSLVLVDVAGTTTSINFVKETLFPFVVNRAEAFLTSKWDQESVKECIAQIRDGEQKLDAAAATALVKSLTEENSANKGLKTLQGLIYQEGYEKGDLKAHVFDDVSEAFETWAKSRQVAVYSTGSVDSQKLLFTHTVTGDLSGHISRYFDQTIGDKAEAASYKKIAEEAQIPPEEIVFITDDVKEATAAKSGGIHAVLIKREGNAALPEEASKEFMVISSFNELTLEKTSKRKMDEGQANPEAPPSKVLKTDNETETTDDNVKQQTEKTESESMEVDSQVEKPAEEITDETKAATEETDNLVKNASEKTENKEVESKVEETSTVDTEMKEVEKEKSEPESEVVSKAPAKESDVTVEETAVETQVAEESQPVVEEPEPTTVVEETEVQTTVEESKLKEQRVVEEIEATAEVTPESVVENVEPVVEEPKKAVEEPKPSTEVTETVAQKSEKVQLVEETAKEEVKVQEAIEPPQEETKKVSEEVKVDEEKTVDEPMENGEEEAATSAPKTDEKENKSVLANGVENGSKDENSEIENATGEKESETAEVTNDDNVDNKDDDNEVKVKKLEESAESKTVSVEV